jgi:hypothetical protein
MSAEEKRKVVLDLYHGSKTVYTEKEILSAAAKAGVNANTYEMLSSKDIASLIISQHLNVPCLSRGRVVWKRSIKVWSMTGWSTRRRLAVATTFGPFPPRRIV